MTRVQLTDEEGEFIEPYLPIGGFGPYPERLRQQFEGVIWRFKTGGQWREMPKEFGLKAALLGRSRGGQSGKIHLVADRKCRPPAFVLTAGQSADSLRFIPVLKKIRVRRPVGRPRTRPGAVAADKAYSSRGNRSYLHKRHIEAVIPNKRDQAANRKKKGSKGGRPVSHDTEPLQGAQHRRASDQRAEGLARHRHPLRL